MAEQSHDANVNERDDGVRRVEDLFRRAAFNWALSTKRLVDTSVAIGPNTRVAYSALADIEYARDLLNGLVMPKALKTPSASADRVATLTVESVQKSVSDLAERVALVESRDDEDSRVNSVVRSASSARKPHRGADFGAPVHPKSGKMLWAGVDCPACPSVATQRCRKPDGEFMEKPHKERIETLLIK